MKDAYFTQQTYNKIVGALDEIVETMMYEHGKTEQQAQEFLEDFIRTHYFGVWRAMNP